MKVTREKAEENRQNVITSSSRLFREKGYDGIGVATLMQAAGLTHGGFYKQFKSKDDLIAQATRVAMEQSRDRLADLDRKNGDTSLEALVQSYLSAAHRDALGQGCVLAALGAEAARHGADVQSVIADGVRGYVEVIRERMPSGTGDGGRQAALAAVSTLVGALILSRAVGTADLSDDLLQAAAAAVLDQDKVTPLPRAEG